MSAWIVSRAHIDVLVSAMINGPADGVSRHCGTSWKYSFGTLPAPTELGRLLWGENLKSVAYRYPDDTPDTRPGPNSKNIDRAISRYTYREPARRFTLAEIDKAVSCYEYQSCEHPEWEKSEAREFCRCLKGALLSSLPGWEEAPWGFEEEHVHPKARRAA